MISAVSGVSFRGATEDFQRLVQSEGKFSNKNAAQTAQTAEQFSAEQPAKKKGKAGKIIGGTLAGIVVAGLALYGLKRGDVLKIDKEATGIVKKSLSKLAEAGDWIGEKIVNPFLKLFKSNKAKDVEKEAEKLFA